MGKLIKSLSLAVLTAFIFVTIVPPAAAGTLTIYNHDCGSKKKREGTKVHIRSSNEDPKPEDRLCTNRTVSVDANSYSGAISLATTSSEGKPCTYTHVAAGMVASGSDEDVPGDADSCVKCQKKGFMKLCHCEKVSCG
ncbi:MAG: hypothetical protein ACE363_07735 [Alphaproteobacteria bacterium]